MAMKNVLGILAVLIGLAGYLPYLRDTFITRKTKPHFFSWLLWGIIEIIAFFAAVSKGAGAGAWVIGVSAVITLAIAIRAFVDRKDLTITKLDWLGLVAAMVGIILWQMTKDPKTAVILVALADAAAFVPTFRKGYSRPNEETILEYEASVIKFLLAILALQAYSLATWFYPATLALSNFIFVVMLMIRRRAKAAS